MSANEAVDGPKAISKDEDRTILVLGFPGIGEQLAPWRDEADDADFPAHITILAPFFPESELEDAVHADLREICAGIASFDINLTSVERVRGFTFLASSQRVSRAHCSPRCASGGRDSCPTTDSTATIRPRT